MPNTFVNTSWVTMEALRILKNKLVVAKMFNMEYSDQYQQPFAVGSTIQIPKPQRWTTRTDLTYSAQNIDRKTTNVTLDQIRGVDFEYTDIEKIINLERTDDRFKRMYIDTAMAQIAQDIDSAAAQFAYQNTNNIVGILGTAPTNTDIAGSARARLVELACPAGDWAVAASPSTMNAIANGVQTYFQDSGQVSKIFKEGYFGRAKGFDWAESMSLYQHTAGTWAGAVTVNGAGQSGTTLNVNCTNGDTFKKGDVISIGTGGTTVYAVNPSTRRSTGTAAQFVVTADVTASGTTAALPIYPGITASGQYQNVSAAPANTAPLTLFPGTTSPNGKIGINNLAMYKDAFAMVSVPLELPKAVEIARQNTDPDTGLTVRFIRAFDPQASKMINRFDVFFGFGVLYGDTCSVRILGAN